MGVSSVPQQEGTPRYVASTSSACMCNIRSSTCNMRVRVKPGNTTMHYMHNTAFGCCPPARPRVGGWHQRHIARSGMWVKASAKHTVRGCRGWGEMTVVVMMMVLTHHHHTHETAAAGRSAQARDHGRPPAWREMSTASGTAGGRSHLRVRGRIKTTVALPTCASAADVPSGLEPRPQTGRGPWPDYTSIDGGDSSGT